MLIIVTILSTKFRTLQPLCRGDRSWTNLEGLDCRKAFIGLGKNQPFPLVTGEGLNSPMPELDSATDLDFIIIAFLFTTSSSTITFLDISSGTPLLLLFCVLNNDQNDLVDRLPRSAGESLSESKSLSSPVNLDLDRRNGIAIERERRREGSLSIML